MQTYSHTIITAALNRVLKRQEDRRQGLQLGRFVLPPLRSGATLIGSFMPDVPLTVVGISFMITDRIQGNNAGFEGDPLRSWTGWLFDYAFFHVWWVELVHNLFHAPLLIFLFAAIGYNGWHKGRQWGSWLFWFALSCLLHTSLDIPLHYDDGPLIFFPLDWETRFHSPVSYWDPRHYGVPFAIFEHLLILSLIGYLLIGWWRNRQTAERVVA